MDNSPTEHLNHCLVHILHVMTFFGEQISMLHEPEHQTFKMEIDGIHWIHRIRRIFLETDIDFIINVVHVYTFAYFCYLATSRLSEYYLLTSRYMEESWWGSLKKKADAKIKHLKYFIHRSILCQGITLFRANLHFLRVAKMFFEDNANQVQQNLVISRLKQLFHIEEFGISWI